MLPATGERLIPWDMQDPTTHYEHLQRYYFASEFATGKKVLDIGSGEGYGPNILAEGAAQVVGLDISKDAVDWANQRYHRPNLKFICGSASAVPISGNALFDLVVCFETIEHITEQETLISEVNRLLKPEGLLIISTPNKAVYSDESNYHNPFHTHELYVNEFRDLVETKLPHAAYLGQRFHPAVAMWPMDRSPQGATDAVIEKHGDQFVRLDRSRMSPMYVVAVASKQPFSCQVQSLISRDSILLDISDTFVKRLLKSCSEHITELLAKERARADRAEADAKAQIDRIEIGANARVACFAASVEAQNRRVKTAETQAAEQQDQLTAYKQATLLLSANLAAIYSSRSWQIASLLQKTKQLQSDVLLGIHLVPKILRWTVSLKVFQKLKLLWSVRASGLFDESFYLEQNPDVAGAHVMPLIHYVSRGAAEGRDPHPLFDSAFYLRNNPDVAQAGLNPLVHYVRHGAVEGRDPHPLFDSSFYLENNPDVAQSGMNPLAHYARHGAAERRRPHPLCDGAVYELAQRMRTGCRHANRQDSAGEDKHPRAVSRSERTAAPRALIGGFDVPHGKEAWDAYARARLEELLGGNRTLSFPIFDQPLVSIILVLYNKAHLSLLSFESLLRNVDVPFEVIIVDNNSHDETADLLKRVNGARVLRNAANVGFGQGCMQAAEQATAEYLCFFNNDAILEPKAVSWALKAFQDHPRVGAVGGKILLADGSLQEAGSVLWSDGSAAGYGRGDDPRLPQYEFKRPVDFCSGAFLFTPRALFTRLGGFSLCFSPAYYEDADYCMRLWSEGLEVVYEPRAVIRHYESASSGDRESARDLMIANRKQFVTRWDQVLSKHLPRQERNLSTARFASHWNGLRVLFIDDRVPRRRLGSGYPRSNEVLSQLLALGCQVTCATFLFALEDTEVEYGDISREVELFDGVKHRDRLFRDYLPNVDVVWISRPHNFSTFLDLAVQLGTGQARIIYDAEAIAAERERSYAHLRQLAVSEPVLNGRMKREIALAHAADAAVVVSQRDLERMKADDLSNVHLLVHCVDAAPTPSPFEERSTFLSVGAMHCSDNPNADSMRYFCSQVWPLVRAHTGAEFVIAGHGTDTVLSDLKMDGVRIVGSVDDLTPLYNQARVMVVPTRYAAGIPLKVFEAAAHGLPVVVSSLVREQLGWRDGEECISANSPEEYVNGCIQLFSDSVIWDRIRAGALVRVQSELSRERFRAQLSRILASVM